MTKLKTKNEVKIFSSTKEEIRIGRKVTIWGLWSNVFLSIFKILAGIFGRSSALVADGVHSISDLLTDFLVLIVISMSRRKEDAKHAYGYGKVETFGTFIISLLLVVVAIFIAVDGVKGVISAFNGQLLPRPGWIALIMAVVSIIIKEVLFQVTRKAARRIGSTALEANAWHHRSDAFSSLATLFGIAGAMFFGARWRLLDPAAAILVSIIIIVMAIRLSRDSINELLEVSLPREIINHATEVIKETQGVEGYNHLRTRRNGSRKIFDFSIEVDPTLTIVKAHNIASKVERRLKKTFGPETLAVIHIEPHHSLSTAPATK